MLPSHAIVSFLWFLVLVSISSAEVFKTPDEIAETQLGVKTAFARQVMEISDLLQMFIALINKAEEAESREFGLPEITTTYPENLESASLEELFDKFERSAQSFRTKFLKYLKTTETPNLSVTPSISNGVELNKEEDLTKYGYENVETDASNTETDNEYGASTVGPDVSNSETNNEYGASTVDSDESDSDSPSEITTLEFILSNIGGSDSEMKTVYSTSTVVPDVSDRDSSSKGTSIAFILSNDEALDSESASAEVSDVTDSSRDMTALEYVLSNEDQEAGESLHAVDDTSNKDVTLTFVPITEENAKSLIDETTFESFLNGNFKTPKLYVAEATFNPESTLNEKPMSTSSDKFLNGAATLMFEPTTDDEAEVSTITFPTTDFTEEVTLTPFTATDYSSYDYTLVPLSTTKDDDSDEETMYNRSTTEDDDSDEEIMDNRSTTEDDDSDEETMDNRSATEDDDSDQETMENRSATEDDDILTTEENEESNKETTSVFTNERDSSVEEMTELVKILREAAEKYDTEESDKRSELEEIRSESRDSESLQESEHITNNAKQIPKVPDPSIGYLMASILSKNEKKADADPVSLKDSHSELNSEDVKNQENISERSGLMQKPLPVYSHLDYVIGLSGEDYPNYTDIATTSFTCEGKEIPGLYADLETRCQVFHACWPQRRESYLCPVGSTFNQRILSCDYWFNSTCSLSQDYYDANHRLRGYGTQIEDGINEYLEENVLYPYNFRLDHSHPVFEEMKFLPFLYKIINHSTKRRGLESGTEIDYNKTVEIEFDKTSILPTFEDVAQQETTTDLVDSVKDRFRELLRSFVASEASKNEESSDEDSSLHKMKLQDRKHIYEQMSKPKLERSGILPEATIKEDLKETTSPKPDGKHGVLHKSTQSKTDKEQISPEIVFKVLATAENVVNKGILPMTRELLAANYVKLYKRKKF